MKYKKKPIEIEAMQWDGSAESYNAMKRHWRLFGSCSTLHQGQNDLQLVINTLEGDMTANASDYIIQGIQGEFYPCKPVIFWASYEPAW